MDEPEKNADGRALACSVGTDEAEKLSLSDGQAEIDDAAGFSVIFREVISCDDVLFMLLSKYVFILAGTGIVPDYLRARVLLLINYLITIISG